MGYLYAKAFHLIFLFSWFAGLFYLPRLFVYHAMCDDEPGQERFKVMERKLFFGIMTPTAILSLGLGIFLIASAPDLMKMGWMHAKLFCVLLLVGYHMWCGKIYFDFKHGRNKKSHVWFRWFNEVPLLFLVAICIFVIVRPF